MKSRRWSARLDKALPLTPGLVATNDRNSVRSCIRPEDGANRMPGNASMSRTEEIIQLLATAPLFGALDADALAACAEKFREVRFAKGEMLFARGDPGTHLYVVAEGQIRIAIATSEGRELSFQIVGPGDMFGEITMLDEQTRSADANALIPTTAYSLERNDFRRLRDAHAAISEAVITYLCRRLREVTDRLETIALYPLETRLARFLLMALKDRPDIAGRRTPLELRYSQSELALLLGASRPKLNAALGALERATAIGRTSDRLFCDRAKLEKIAQVDEA
jgi:CRP/FNR family cyclic AMP-dependent transcriptional regulator